MSIATELTNLAANRDAIKAAIEAKGVADAGDTLAEFPASIASIPSGGGGGWQPPSDWPNIRTLLANDTENYPHKIYCLFDALRSKTVPNIFNFLNGTTKAVTSDGSTYTSNASHTWSSEAQTARWCWIAWYSSSGFTQIGQANFACLLWLVGSVGSPVPAVSRSFAENVLLREVDLPLVADSNSSQMFYNCQMLASLPKSINTSAVTNGNGMFQSCVSLGAAPDLSALSAIKNVSSMFAGCTSMSSLPSKLAEAKPTNASRMCNNCRSITSCPAIDFSLATDVNNAFSDSWLIYPPNVLDLSSATNVNSMFSYASRLRKLPTHMTCNLSLSFQQSTAVDDKASVATFDDETSPTSVTGGFVGNLNTCTASGQTITLNSSIKGLFTATEQNLIASALTAKNWTLAW